VQQRDIAIVHSDSAGDLLAEATCMCSRLQRKREALARVAAAEGPKLHLKRPRFATQPSVPAISATATTATSAALTASATATVLRCGRQRWQLGTAGEHSWLERCGYPATELAVRLKMQKPFANATLLQAQ
jgi:hypothetical protein